MKQRELNPRESVWMRFAFASRATLYCIAGGILFGAAVMVAQGIRP